MPHFSLTGHLSRTTSTSSASEPRALPRTQNESCVSLHLQASISAHDILYIAPPLSISREPWSVLYHLTTISAAVISMDAS